MGFCRVKLLTQVHLSAHFLYTQVILVFPYQMAWQYSVGNPRNGGVECRCGRQKRNSGRISGFAAYRSTMLSTVRVAKCEKQCRDERRQALSTHCGVRRPLFAQDDNEVFMTGSTYNTPETKGGQTPPWS